MPEHFKTPGVYIVEKSAFPNSVVEVSTGVPAFVGYTETAVANEKSLRNVPCRISSMTEYQNHFGFGPPVSYSISESRTELALKDPVSLPEESSCFLTRSSQRFYLYYGMLSYFENGGGACYVVSVGDYASPPQADALKDGLATLVKEQEPALLVIPDAAGLDDDACFEVQIASLAQCGEMQSRFAILDVYNGFNDRAVIPDCITELRDKIGSNNLKYGAAYYPWLETTTVQDSDFSYRNIDDDSLAVLQEILKVEFGIGESPEGKGKQIAGLIEKLGGTAWSDDEQKDLAASEDLLHKSLFAVSKSYLSILKSIQGDVNILPPSAALAGVYARVDNSRGVWKAPANESLNGVIRPVIDISDEEQVDLNVDVNGKSVNAIRRFVGRGTLVWGARTLDGNSLDWRYINVRRTCIMLEQSIKLAVEDYVFEANDANTWITIKSMVNNFLTAIWRRGGIAGAKPDDAFSVSLGFGETMTADDVLEGILRITVFVALIRPAEFIEITFQQQMQKPD